MSTRRVESESEPVGARASIRTRRRAAAALACLAALVSLAAMAGPAGAQVHHGSAVTLDGSTEESLREVARQVHNPVGPLWQLTLDSQILGMGGGGLGGMEPAYVGSFEPQGPLWRGRERTGRLAWLGKLALFAQLTVPFAQTLPVARGSGGDTRRSGFGDIQLGSVFAPKRLEGFVWGLGPTFIFPSASDDALGQGKWQAGPAAVVGYVGEKWVVHATAQQWWSFAGDADRARTNQLSLGYAVVRSLPHRWQLGMQPTLTVDWTATARDAVALPVGLGIGKTLRIGGLPVQLWLEADYYAVRPDRGSAPRWGIDLQIAPVIAAPF